MISGRQKWIGPLAFIALGGAGVAIGCHLGASAAPAREPQQQTAPQSETAKAPASAPSFVLWDKSAKGIKLKYPSDWHPKQSADYELMLLPAGATADDRRLTMDIPDLPPHLPFMIQMKRVEHDYLQDLKKEHPDLQERDSTDAKVPESAARVVRSFWHQGKQERDDIALLVIHASSVYILDARSDADHLTPDRAAFDSIRESIVWTKH